MASDEDIKALAKIALAQKVQINALFGVCNDFACLIETALQRCEHSRCKDAATVMQVDVKVKMCDYHAAAAMLRARANLLQGDPNDALVLLRARSADEECWVDLPNAVLIRRLGLYVNELRKNDEPEPPADKAEFH